MNTIHGTDPIAAARHAYEAIRNLGDPAFDDLSIDDQIALMDLGLTDPTTRSKASTIAKLFNL